jgi:type IV secretory pathway TraG/TraD family ATPase VirD4
MGVTLGTNQYNGEEVILSDLDRLRHMHVIGQTGTGKSTFLTNSIIQDIHNGEGIAFLDPHGDDAEALLDHIPPDRTSDVIYFNPADIEYPIGFNPLQNVSPDNRHLVADGIVSTFKSMWPHLWGEGRMEYITYQTLVTLLDYENATLLGLKRLLSNKAYRNKVLTRLKDPEVRLFWNEEFNKWDNRYRNDAIAPIQNKVGQLFSNAIIRNILGQVRSAIDFRRVMDGRQIFIANLSKGKLGDTKSRLLGSLIVSQFKHAAMSRANLPKQDRIPFHLYIDEFQNFTTDTFQSILSESRKFGLSLTLAHQYFDQLDPEIRSAVFGNVGTFIQFRVGNDDAALLDEKLNLHTVESLKREDFLSLPNGTAYVGLLVDGVPTKPIPMQTFEPPRPSYNNRDIIIRHCRRKFSRSRKEIEQKIQRFLRA